MAEPGFIADTKISAGWRMNLVAEAKAALEKLEKRPIKIGTRIGFFLEGGQLVIRIPK